MSGGSSSNRQNAASYSTSEAMSAPLQNHSLSGSIDDNVTSILSVADLQAKIADVVSEVLLSLGVCIQNRGLQRVGLETLLRFLGVLGVGNDGKGSPHEVCLTQRAS